MVKYLRCHTEAADLTVGKSYEVLSESDGCYVIRNDRGVSELFTIKPDEDGDSYRNWFTLETEKGGNGLTVLPDESLGGVKREYREVKRKAAVGERIIVVDAKMSNGTYAIGDVLTVRGTSDKGGAHIETNGQSMVSFLFASEYAVLEPTDIVRIDGARFRMVDRKAAVGERVIIVSKRMSHGIPIGSVGFIENRDMMRSGGPAYFVGNDKEPDASRDYRVLEPVETEQAEPTPPAPTVETLEALAARVEALESEVAALKTQAARQFVAKATEVLSGSVAKSLANPAKTAAEIAQAKRDEIIERAKADVKKITEDLYGEKDGGAFTKYGTPGHMRVKFVIDREKRTVVALVGWRYASGIRDRGIAKCAPGEVLNVHIGKVIALYRAIKREVPVEYLSVPQPTEIRVGDIVTGHGHTGPVYAIKPRTRTTGAYDLGTKFEDYTNGLTFMTELWGEPYEFWAHLDDVTIIDDSREEAESPAFSTKGAAA